MLFGRHFDPYVVSQFCNALNQRMTRIDPKISTQAIMSTIQAMSEVGQLPKVELMEEVNSEHLAIVVVEGNYT